MTIYFPLWIKIWNFDNDFVLKGLQEPILGPAAGQPSLWRHLHMRSGQHRRRRRWQQRRPLANRRFAHLSDTVLFAQRRPSADPYCKAHTGGWPLANRRRRRRKGGRRWIRLPGQLQLSHQDSPRSGGAWAGRAALFRGFQASSREIATLKGQCDEMNNFLKVLKIKSKGMGNLNQTLKMPTGSHRLWLWKVIPSATRFKIICGFRNNLQNHRRLPVCRKKHFEEG